MLAMNRTYIPALLTLILLAVLHFLASAYSLYVRLPGYDIPMHIIGGAGLALSIYWIFVTFFKDIKVSILRVIILTILIGISWELLEYYYDIAGAPLGTIRYYLDTTKDILNDTVGALIAIYFLYRK